MNDIQDQEFMPDEDFVPEQEPEEEQMDDNFDFDSLPKVNQNNINNQPKSNPANEMVTDDIKQKYPDTISENEVNIEKNIVDEPKRKSLRREDLRKEKVKKQVKINKKDFNTPVGKVITGIVITSIISLISHQFNLFLLNSLFNLFWIFVFIIFTVTYGFLFVCFQNSDQKNKLNNKMRIWYNELYDGDLTKQYKLYNQLNLLILIAGLSISLVGGQYLNNQLVAGVILFITLYFWYKFRTAIKLHRNPIKLANAVFDIIKDWTHTNKIIYLGTEIVLIYAIVQMLIPDLIRDLSRVNWF